MRIFKNKKFTHFAIENNITDIALCKTIANADKGLIEANLGGGVIKQRIAREGEGKSGGYRTIIYYRKDDKAFFVHGYAKNDKANITKFEESVFKSSAKITLNLSDTELKTQIKEKKLLEVAYGKKI